MAEHVAPEYATAPGNDYTSHEGTYEAFVHMVFIGALHVATVLIGLAIGGVNGTLACRLRRLRDRHDRRDPGLHQQDRAPSYGALVLALLALAVAAGGAVRPSKGAIECALRYRVSRASSRASPPRRKPSKR